MADEQAAGDETYWVKAPDSSHLESFAYFDRRDASNDVGTRLLTRHVAAGVLWVRFRATKTKPGSQYQYRFQDPAEGARVFEMLKAHDEPGKVVHTELILRKVPYERVVG